MKAAQPRWTQKRLGFPVDRIDLNRAMQTFTPLLDRFEFSMRLAPTPLYSGGLYDAWPNLDVEGLSICREELGAVQAYEAGESRG